MVKETDRDLHFCSSSRKDQNAKNEKSSKAEGYNIITAGADAENDQNEGGRYNNAETTKPQCEDPNEK